MSEGIGKGVADGSPNYLERFAVNWDFDDKLPNGCEPTGSEEAMKVSAHFSVVYPCRIFLANIPGWVFTAAHDLYAGLGRRKAVRHAMNQTHAVLLHH